MMVNYPYLLRKGDFTSQGLLHNMWGPAQNENVGLLQKQLKRSVKGTKI